MNKSKLEAVKDDAHRRGWNAAIRHSIRVIQAWERGEHQITRELKRSICKKVAKVRDS